MHLPRLRATGRSAARVGRAAAGLLRLGGAQRPPGPPGAAAARGRGRREGRGQGGSVTAEEAYRAVFLRVHPTGKMVLSLTTESDGNERRYAELVGQQLGVPALDVKVVPADTDRFGEAHGFNTSPSPGTEAAIVSATGKIRDKAQQLAGAALGTAPDTLAWDSGAFVADGNGAEAKTIADIALYAHGSGALPPGVEGGLDAQTVYRD